ncbi:MAG TPA: low temperature requirement protein A [Gaiellaceae bacterium]|nr:low temperature requirement protein A [Gaiellaceae bacterium]
MSELIDRSARVSSLELFFDLVFVFTITQLTGVLVTGVGAASALQVIVMLALIWWMYDGYAWLTNAIATDLLRFRLLLLGGMGGFLVIALAIPTAYQGQGLAFGIGYVVVVVLHAGMYSKSTSVSEVAAILRILPYNLTAAGLVLLGGIVGGRAQDVIWVVAAVVLWATGWFANTEGFVIVAEHFVERHGLVIIIALGESIVVIGVAAAGVPLDLRLVVVALLTLALSAALWWLYFRDEDAVERAMLRADQALRARLSLIGFGYWHYGLLLGVVAIAAGLKKAIGDPYDSLGGWIGAELGAGVALFVWCTVGFCRMLGLGVSVPRLLAGAAAIATIPIGTEWTATAQLGALVAIVAVGLVVESSGVRRVRRDPAAQQS